MKAWNTLLGLGVCTLLATACTVSTSTDDDEDPGLNNGDEVPFGDDDTADDDTSDDDTGDDDTGDDDTGDDDTGDDDTGDDDTGDDDTGDDDVPDSGADDDTPDDDEPFMCMPESAEGECEQCVQTDCCDERADCAGDAECTAQWETLKTCMADKDLENNPSEDPAAEITDCLGQLEGDPFNTQFQSLLTCVGETFTGSDGSGDAADAGAGDAGAATDDPFGRIAGEDGTCTFQCYGVFTVQPPDVNDDVDTE